jgi:hypothetical protein
MSKSSRLLGLTLAVAALASASPVRAEESLPESLAKLAATVRTMADRNPQQGTLTGNHGVYMWPRASSNEAAYVVEQLIDGASWGSLTKATQRRLAAAVRAANQHIVRNGLTEHTPLERGMAEGAIGIHIPLHGFGESSRTLSIMQIAGGPRTGSVEITVPRRQGGYISQTVHGPVTVDNPFISGGVRGRAGYQGKPTWVAKQR